MKRIRRRQYLVDRPLQIGYAANMILLQLVVAVVTTGVVAWIVLFVLDRRLTGQMETGFLVKLAVIALFMAAGVGIWAVRYTHAVAGPVFKARRILKEAAAGRLPAAPVAFRRNDAFKDLAVDLNGLFRAMARRQKHWDALKTAAADVGLPAEKRLANITALLAAADMPSACAHADPKP